MFLAETTKSETVKSTSSASTKLRKIIPSNEETELYWSLAVCVPC
jgi:hypothetical protein